MHPPRPRQLPRHRGSALTQSVESDLSTSDDDEEEEEEEESEEESSVSDSDSDDSCPARVTVDPSEINDNPLASLLSPHPSDSIVEMIRCLDRYTRTRVERRLAFFYDPYEDSLSSSPTGKKPKKVAATVAVRGLQQELARVKELLATSDVRANALLTMAHSFSYRYQTVWMRHQKKIKALEAKIVDAPTAKQLDMRAAAALERCGFVSGLYEDAPAIIFELEDTSTNSTSNPKPQADEKAGKSRSGKQQPGRGRNAAAVQNEKEEKGDPSMAVFDLCPKAQLTKRVKRARTPAIPAPEGPKKGRKFKSVPRVRGDFITPDFTFLNPDGGELTGTALQVLYEVAKLEPRVDILAMCFNTDRRTIQRHLHGEYQRQGTDSESEERTTALSKEKKERRVRIEALLRSGAEVEGWGPAVDVGRCKEHLRLNGISVSERRVERELRRIGLLSNTDD